MKKLEKILESATRTSHGAYVVSIEGMSAESTATLHSLNSREPGGWRENLKKLFDSAGNLVKRILSLFYVGYGHKSIGDCGSGDVLIDACSILAAHHLQHWRLYNGQETSTRYVDVTSTKGGFVEVGDEFVDGWSLRWLEFYQRILPATIEMLKGRHPHTGKDDHGQDLSEGEWLKAIRARACDICGAFLPCSARTNVSEHMELRQFADQLKLLEHHPLAELREIAQAMKEQLMRDHPNSFKARSDGNAAHARKVASQMFYHEPKTLQYSVVVEWYSETNIDPALLKRWYGPVLKREAKDELPFDIGRLGNVNVESLLDFRSFRDLHRQRSLIFQMPIVSPEYGFEEWYLDLIPGEFRSEAEALAAEYCEAHRMKIEERDNIDVGPILQYSTPMGFRVPCLASGPLDAAVYVTELRSGTSVHQTVRDWAVRLGDDLEKWFPELQVHVCREPDAFRLGRGKQDIVRKEESAPVK